MKAFGVNKETGRPGPAPNPPRDGDRKQARRRINVEVRTGRRPHPNELPCVDCGHVWVEGERRHEYDHHLGYAPEHHYDVEPVCTACHKVRTDARGESGQLSRLADACKHGHPFTPENTGRHAHSGRRFCRECRRIRDRNRRDAAYWREYRAKRKGQDGG